MDRVQKQFIKDAMDMPENLSDWENEFIDSLASKEAEYKLSEKQVKVLNRISQKLF